MPKYKVRMWYTCPVYKDIIVEADDEGHADWKVYNEVWPGEDISDWIDSSDGIFEVDIEEMENAPQ